MTARSVQDDQFKPYFEQIDQIDESVNELANVAKYLDQYTRNLGSYALSMLDLDIMVTAALLKHSCHQLLLSLSGTPTELQLKPYL